MNNNLGFSDLCLTLTNYYQHTAKFPYFYFVVVVVGFVVGLFVGTAIVGVSGRGTNGLNATDGPG